MSHKIYTVYDAKLEHYNQPMIAINKGDIGRLISDWVNNPQHPFHKYAEDFTLFEIGEWEEKTGLYKEYAAKQPMGCLIEYKKQNEQNERLN